MGAAILANMSKAYYQKVDHVPGVLM